MLNKQLEQAVEITTELGQALRQASSLVFHYRKGQSYIRCLKENVGVWKETKEVRIDCGTFTENYGGRLGLGDIRSASHVETAIQFHRPLQTVLSKVRKGDKLILRWVANNNSQYLTKNGLYKDELYLVVHRKDKQEEYYIGCSVCENNTAKMIKNESTPLSVTGE